MIFGVVWTTRSLETGSPRGGTTTHCDGSGHMEERVKGEVSHERKGEGKVHHRGTDVERDLVENHPSCGKERIRWNSVVIVYSNNTL